MVIKGRCWLPAGKFAVAQAILSICFHWAGTTNHVSAKGVRTRAVITVLASLHLSCAVGSAFGLFGRSRRVGTGAALHVSAQEQEEQPGCNYRISVQAASALCILQLSFGGWWIQEESSLFRLCVMWNCRLKSLCEFDEKMMKETLIPFYWKLLQCSGGYPDILLSQYLRGKAKHSWMEEEKGDFFNYNIHIFLSVLLAKGPKRLTLCYCNTNLSESFPR